MNIACVGEQAELCFTDGIFQKEDTIVLPNELIVPKDSSFGKISFVKLSEILGYRAGHPLSALLYDSKKLDERQK